MAALEGAPASAGPWAREAGDLFISFQISAEQDPSQVIEQGLWEPEAYASLYTEYGLGRSLTLGADIGRGEVSQSGVAFLRYTLTPPDATWQWAVDGGLGVRQTGEGQSNGLVRLGASVGRGLGEHDGGWPMLLRHQGGWIALDAALLYDLEVEDVIWQTEGTLGLSLTDRTTAIFSLKAEEWPGADLVVTATPSLAFDILPDTTLRIGARGALTGSSDVGVLLSLWHTF
ncbi:hypothetical protein [Gymnodinialimonas ulvae]|uniref:hypothetical protein n=1 Tax=Gymnodinialimonas ulvae TaxID=3126504 RepID=UPI0030EDDC4D